MEMKKYKLGEIADIIVGYPFESAKFNTDGNGVLLVRGMNVSERFLRFGDEARYWDYITDDLKPYYLKENDIVIGMDGSKVGKNFALVKKENLPLLLVQRVACVRAKKDYDQRYIWQYVSSKRFIEYVNTIKTGSSIPHISGNQIANFPIFVPDSKAQKKIADVLSSLDDKIALNRRMNAKLEQMAKRLYDHWFVQFDFPNADGKPYKSSGGKMEYNEILKREIPVGWEVGNLYDIAEYVNGLACQNYRPKAEEAFLPVIKIREMNEGISSDTEKVSANIPEKYKIFDGDILFSWSASLEVMIWAGGYGGLNQHIFKVNPKSYFSKEYIYQQLQSYLINFQKMAESRKTTMGHITSNHINQSRVLLPPKEIISAFNEKTLSIFNYQLSIEKETQKLTALRDRLLPLLMNGQVEVK
ncbi:MAG: restriction endonuclease subunit S [Treponema sp.]|nr:restriction endonuclease subunit S [Treponema sp.]